VRVLGEHRVRHEGNSITALALSRDGKLAATGDGSGVIWLSDPETLRAIAQLPGHKGTAVRGLAFSPDGKTLAAAGADKMVRLWNVAGAPPAGQPVLKEEPRRLKGHTEAVRCVAFAARGKLLLSGGEDKTVRVWDVKEGKEVGRYGGHTTGVACVAVSPDGKQALSGGGGFDDKNAPVDCDLHLWDVATTRATGNFKGHTSPVTGIAWSRDGQLVLSGGHDGLRWWEPATGKQIPKPETPSSRIEWVAFSPDGGHALAAANDPAVARVRLLDTKKGGELRTFGVYSPAVAFFPDSHRALVASGDTLRVWDTATGTELHPFVGHTAPVTTMTFSQDGRYLLSGGEDNALRLWDLNSGQDLRRLPGTVRPVSRVALSPDGNYALSATIHSDVPLRLQYWDIARGESVRELKGHVGQVSYTAFLAADGQALTAGHDGTLRQWDVASGKDRVLKKFDTQITRVVLSPDGNQALCLLNDSTLHLWDLKENTEVGAWSGSVASMTFAANGRQLYAGLTDGKVVVCDLPPAKPEWSEPFFHRHRNPVHALAMAPGGKTLVSADQAGMVLLWDTSAHDSVGQWQQPGGVNDLVFARDGRLATANVNGTVYILRLTLPSGE
jgi:WD40 repeat protein